MELEQANYTVNHRRIAVRGEWAIMPTRADALPLIEAALRKREGNTGI